MDNDLTSSVVIKKEIFIPSRQEDIIKYYQFFPKVKFLKFLVFGSGCLWDSLSG